MRRSLAALLCASLCLASWPLQAAEALKKIAPGPSIPPLPLSAAAIRPLSAAPLAAVPPSSGKAEPALRAAFDGAPAAKEEVPAAEPPAAPAAPPSGVEPTVRALAGLRAKVQKEARDTLRTEAGGDLGDGRLHKDLKRVLRRLTKAAGLPPEAAQIFVGGSFIPNAFTTIPAAEAKYLEENASLAKVFRIASVFVSLGLLRALKSEAQLAFVLAHELSHNWRGHLKDFDGSHQLLGHFHEFEADQEALKLMAKAGYDPREAVDTLYGLHEEMERLRREYSLLKGHKDDILETLQRLQDVHPHPDLRKANLLDHMDEALEAYAPPPADVPGRRYSRTSPAWMESRELSQRPSRWDRLQARLKKAASGPGPLEDQLRRVEAVVERSQHRGVEELAVLEETYRDLARRAVSPDELRYIEVSARRLHRDNFPSRRLHSALVTRQLDLILGGSDATLDEFESKAPSLTQRVRRAGTMRLLGTARDRRALDGAFRALSREAENLGLDVGDGEMKKTLSFAVARRLWPAARRVLTEELGRPAKPEEIIAELRAKLAPSLLRDYAQYFNAQILESAFGPAAYRSEAFSPSDLARLITGREPEKTRRPLGAGEEAVLDGLVEWGRNHHRSTEAKIDKDGKVAFRYERFYLDRLAPPSLRDQLDIAWRFWTPFLVEPRSGHLLLQLLPAAFIQLLRQHGQLIPFVTAAYRDLDAELKRRLALASDAPDRNKALVWYDRVSSSLLCSALKGSRSLAATREILAAAWAELKPLLESAEPAAQFAPQTRSQLASDFFHTAGRALRRNVLELELAGERPSIAEVRAISALVQDVDKTLMPVDRPALVKSHARHLLRSAGRILRYMKAYHLALPGAVEPFWVPFRVQLLFSLVPSAVVWLYQLACWGLAGTHAPWSAVVVHSAFSPGLFLLIKSCLFVERRLREWLHPLPADELHGQDFVHLLGLLGQDDDPGTKVMAAALLDKLDMGRDNGKDRRGEGVGMHASVAVGRWLLEDAVASVKTRGQAASLAGVLLRINSYHPGFLQGDMRYRGDGATGFRAGAKHVRRNEALRSAAKAEHPFRGVATRWALDLMGRLDAWDAWPPSLSDRLDLLDLLNSSGEFSDALDRRILAWASADPAGFRRWVAMDRKRVKLFRNATLLKDTGSELGERERSDTIATPFGFVPLPTAQPLRLVRNPALRAQLFGLLKESRVGEKPSLSPWARLRAWFRLLKEYRNARKYFSKEFLRDISREGSLEDKFVSVLEEADRYAAAEKEKRRRRWEEGGFDAEDLAWFYLEEGVDKGTARNAAKHGKTLWPKRWKNMPPHEKEEKLEAYRAQKRAEALAAIQDLYTAYAAAQEPVLGLLLENYPEPTRSRDELLERLIKARRLTPGQLSFLEQHKSYRQPNPVRVMEKHLMESALVQMRKFSPSERVDILLHLADIRPLPKERLSAFNRRILSGDRRKLARDRGALRSVAQLKSYLSLLHAKDRQMLVRAQFYGEGSLNDAPEEVRRLYEAIVIEGRDLPPFLEAVFRVYFDVLTPDERAQLISQLAALEDLGPGLKGPDLLRAALKNRGVMGAKIAQVLSTHRGLIPAEYAAVLDDFKDRAQDMNKMRAFDLTQERLGALLPPQEEETAQLADLEGWIAAALPQDSPAARKLVKDQVSYLLRERHKRFSTIEYVGLELGSGSIKVVYKMTLDDGRVWVVKLRAPGVAKAVHREFEIVEQLVSGLQKGGFLDLPGAPQLVDELKSLVRAEMNFVEEAAKESAMRGRVARRGLFGSAPHVPEPHPIYVSESLLVEEYVPSIRFADLPRWSLFGPSQRKIAKKAVDEGMRALIVEGWLEPDPHTGNRHALRRWLSRLWTRLVVMDLGQGEPVDVARLKPLMKAALALERGDADSSAAFLLDILEIPEGFDRAALRAAVGSSLRSGDGGVIERLMEGLVAAAKEDVLVKPEFASLEKGFILYAGYAPYLPKDYLFHSLERAVMRRALLSRPLPLSRLTRLELRRRLLGSRAVANELDGLIDRL